jgi:aminoglycoside phosphotransferase (APT) family kinase protein
VLSTVADPGPLLAALADEPATLLHGDYQRTNLALAEDGAVIALDWGLAAWGPAELDYVWFLSNMAWGDDDERERIEARWADLTGVARDSRLADLAVAFHAAMGELAFVVSEPVYALAGQPAPSPATAAWWQRRTRAAYERLGWLLT